MNQIKIGKFIAECRKDKKLTQEQLAEMLNTTNKSISKWENGNCLPDSSLYEPLCNILEITFANHLVLCVFYQFLLPMKRIVGLEKAFAAVFYHPNLVE